MFPRTVHVESVASFKGFSPELLWWAENLKIEVVSNQGNYGLKFLIDRAESWIQEGPEIRESVFGLSPHLKKWLDFVLEGRMIEIAH